MLMNNSVTRILAVAALLVWVPNLSAVNITYNLQSYNAAQGGATLSGSITTDGSTGALTTSDILSWQFTITTLTDIFTGSSTNAGATATVANAAGHGIADATRIFLPVTGNTTNRSLLLKDPITGNEILWSRYPGADVYRARRNTSIDIWNLTSVYSSTGAVALPTTAAMVIAVLAPAAAIVPEPTSLTLMSISIVSLASMRRRRQAARVV